MLRAGNGLHKKCELVTVVLNQYCTNMIDEKLKKNSKKNNNRTMLFYDAVQMCSKCKGETLASHPLNACASSALSRSVPY